MITAVNPLRGSAGFRAHRFTSGLLKEPKNEHPKVVSQTQELQQWLDSIPYPGLLSTLRERGGRLRVLHLEYKESDRPWVLWNQALIFYHHNVYDSNFVRFSRRLPVIFQESLAILSNNLLGDERNRLGFRKRISNTKAFLAAHQEDVAVIKRYDPKSPAIMSPKAAFVQEMAGLIDGRSFPPQTRYPTVRRFIQETLLDPYVSSKTASPQASETSPLPWGDVIAE